MLNVFISQAPTDYRFTFKLRFLYELKHKVCPTNFVQQNAWTL